MLTQIGNVHRSKVPRIGEVGYLTDGQTRYGEIRYWGGKRQRWQVESYPLTDSADPRYSIGFHTATFRNLRNGQRVRMSGFYFKTDEEL